MIEQIFCFSLFLKVGLCSFFYKLLQVIGILFHSWQQIVQNTASALTENVGSKEVWLKRYVTAQADGSQFDSFVAGFDTNLNLVTLLISVTILMYLNTCTCCTQKNYLASAFNYTPRIYKSYIKLFYSPIPSHSLSWTLLEICAVFNAVVYYYLLIKSSNQNLNLVKVRPFSNIFSPAPLHKAAQFFTVITDVSCWPKIWLLTICDLLHNFWKDEEIAMTIVKAFL